MVGGEDAVVGEGHSVGEEWGETVEVMWDTTGSGRGEGVGLKVSRSSGRGRAHKNRRRGRFRGRGVKDEGYDSGMNTEIIDCEPDMKFASDLSWVL